MSKKDSKQSAVKLTIDLLYFCKRTDNWNPDFTSEPLLNLLSFLSNQPDFKDIWDLELAERLLNYFLNKSTLKEKQTFAKLDAEKNPGRYS